MKWNARAVVDACLIVSNSHHKRSPIGFSIIMASTRRIRGQKIVVVVVDRLDDLDGGGHLSEKSIGRYAANKL
jgi:hypothetical protein